MDELLAYLMAAAVQLSGLPPLAERPPVTPMPYQKMLVEILSLIHISEPTRPY